MDHANNVKLQWIGHEFTITEGGIAAKAAKVDKYHAVSVAKGMSEPLEESNE